MLGEPAKLGAVLHRHLATVSPMTRLTFAIAASAACLVASSAVAGPVAGAAAGAAAGAVVAGPPGLVIGGVTGAVLGGHHRHRARRVRHVRVVHHAAPTPYRKDAR